MAAGSSISKGPHHVEIPNPQPGRGRPEDTADSGELDSSVDSIKGAVPIATPGDITHLLVAWSQGDLDALDSVFPLAFEDLRRIARKSFGRRPVENLQPTELIGEIYEVLLKQRSVSWQSRGQFYSFAAFLMERFLLGYKRALDTGKRGGQGTAVPLADAMEVAVGSDASSLSVGSPTLAPQSSSREATLKVLGVAVDITEKLAELAELDPRQAEIVRLRYLIGLTQEETAKTLGVSVKTVGRNWRNAKRFLARELDEYSDD